MARTPHNSRLGSQREIHVTCPVLHFWNGQEGSQFISQLGTECRNLAGMKGFSYKATFCLPRSESLSSTLPFHHLHHAVPRYYAIVWLVLYILITPVAINLLFRLRKPGYGIVKSGMLSLHIMIALRLAAFVSEIVLTAEEGSGNFNLSALVATIICIGAGFFVCWSAASPCTSPGLKKRKARSFRLCQDCAEWLELL